MCEETEVSSIKLIQLYVRLCVRQFSHHIKFETNSLKSLKWNSWSSTHLHTLARIISQILLSIVSKTFNKLLHSLHWIIAIYKYAQHAVRLVCTDFKLLTPETLKMLQFSIYFLVHIISYTNTWDLWRTQHKQHTYTNHKVL